MKKTFVVLAALSASVLVGCGPEVEAVPGSAGETSVSQHALSGPMPYRGVNLAGAEFGIASDGTGANPGAHGTNYIYPDAAYASGYSADYFIAKGMTTFRLPFRWERLQRTRGAAFDAAELTRLRTTVTGLTNKGAVVLLDPHNYARYGTALIGSSSVTNADFADFWSRLANEFKANPNVLFGLMNEPYDMPTEQWVSAANAAITAIRATGATNLVLVPGNAWTGAHSWTQNWYGTPNSVALLAIRDPGNNYAFEVHQYFDSNSSGSSSTCPSSNVGAAQFGELTTWLRANGKRAFLGEFAVGSSSTCLTALENVLAYLDANSDVYLGWTWWAAGPWWGTEWTSLEPQANGADKPQMAVIARHLAAAAPAPTCGDGVKNGAETGIDCGGSCAACAPVATCTDGVKNGAETGIDCGGSCAACAPAATTCQATTWEAELAYHSSGGKTSGGWNLWSNGYLETTSATAQAGTTLIVTARGTSAGGVWPRMTVSLGGTTLGVVSVTSNSWVEYRFAVSADASGPLRVTYDNDEVINGADRNLLVDKLASECGGMLATVGPVTPRACTEATYEAEAMTHSTGGKVTGGWNLWTTGYASTTHRFLGGPAVLAVTARGSAAGGVWPQMSLYVAGELVARTTVSSTNWKAYTFELGPDAGPAEVRVTFDNDAVIGREDRNLYLDKLVVRCP